MSSDSIAELGSTRIVATGSASANSSATSDAPESVSQSNCRSQRNITASIGIQTDVQQNMKVAWPLWYLALTPFNPPKEADVDQNAIDAFAQALNLANESECAGASKPSRPFPLYSDVLQVILRYLNTNDLLCAIQLSKLWYKAFNTAHCLGLTSKLSAGHLMCMPAHSSISRHIADSPNLQLAIAQSHNELFEGFTIAPHLAMLLPNLTRLTLTVSVKQWDLPAVGVSWLPSLLKELKLTIESPKNCPSLLTAAGQLKHLQDFTLMGHYEALQETDFSPLLPLKHLQSMTFAAQNGKPFNTATLSSLMHFIRQTRVNNLTLLSSRPEDQFSSQLLDRKPADPSFPLMESGSLTSLNAACTRSIFQVLPNYPSVTKLSTSCIALEVKAPKISSSFPQITEFNVPAMRITNLHVTCDSIVEVCQYLQRLQTVHVAEVLFNSDQLNALLSHLPYLTDLKLNNGSLLSTFAPFSGYGLRNRLVKLSLKGSRVFPSELISYILPLQELEYLYLEDVCTKVIPERTKERLRDLPKLKECILIHGTPIRNTRSQTLRSQTLNITSDEEADQYQADPNQKGTRVNLFEPCIEENTTRDNGYSFIIETYHSISSMKEYRHKSVEELRLEDEEIGLENPPPLRKALPVSPVQFGSSAFGSIPQSQNVFGLPPSSRFSVGFDPASARAPRLNPAHVFQSGQTNTPSSNPSNFSFGTFAGRAPTATVIDRSSHANPVTDSGFSFGGAPPIQPGGSSGFGGGPTQFSTSRVSDLPVTSSNNAFTFGSPALTTNTPAPSAPEFNGFIPAAPPLAPPLTSVPNAAFSIPPGVFAQSCSATSNVFGSNPFTAVSPSIFGSNPLMELTQAALTPNQTTPNSVCSPGVNSNTSS